MSLLINPVGGYQNLSFGANRQMGDPMSTINGIGSFGQQNNNYGMGPAGGPASIAIQGVPAPMQASSVASVNSNAGASAGRGIDLNALAGMSNGGGAGEGGWFQKMGGIEGLGSITSGLGNLAGIWGAIQQVGLAREQLKFDRSSYATNLGNQTQSYNTALEDRVMSRYSPDSPHQKQAAAYLKKHSL